jgi:hypothetical protein
MLQCAITTILLFALRARHKTSDYGHVPVPVTGIETVLAGLLVSVTVTVPVNEEEGFARATVNVEGNDNAGTVAPELLDAAEYGPDPPEIVTGTDPQPFSVTLEGDATSVTGQAPAPSPVRFTVTFAVVLPSVTPTFTGPAIAGDGFLREIVKVPPREVVVSASLPELSR